MSGLTNDRMQSGEMARHGPEDLRERKVRCFAVPVSRESLIGRKGSE
ncbi:hypothetical protein [Paenibacillus sp. GCM10012303]|jgi:hypothetical protein